MIKLPMALQLKLEALLQNEDKLVQGYQDLSGRYHAQSNVFLQTEAEVLAYLAARMPATYAALISACTHVSTYLDIKSVTDLGSGPGTALWAFQFLWPDLVCADVIEHNPLFLSLNRHLAPLEKIFYHQKSFLDLTVYPPNDAVVLSYALNEVKDKKSVIERAWAATQKCLIIVEPGTPVGFQNILAARELLIHKNAFIASPCPHHGVCPLSVDDWCHFSVRLERTRDHRVIKQGQLMYEDEKYTYIIATREAVKRPLGRIIKRPLQRSGHVRLDICTSQGLERPVLSKRDSDLYKIGKKLDWGDDWNFC